MSEPNKVEWCHCNKCMRGTRHRTLFSESRGEEVGDFVSGSDYQVLECQGCGSVAFRKRDWCSEWVDEEGPCLRWTPLSRPKSGDPSLLPCQALMALASR